MQEKSDFSRPYPYAQIGSAYTPSIKANGADSDSQFWREQAPTKTCESRGSSGGVVKPQCQTEAFRLYTKLTTLASKPIQSPERGH